MPRQGLTRDSVIAAAIKIANKKGYAELTVGSLARELNIKPPSLYKHIASLEDLQDSIGAIAAKELNAALLPATLEKDAGKAMRLAAVAYRDFARAKPGLYAALQPAMVRRNAEFQQAATSLVQTIFQLIAALGVQKEELVHATRALRAMLHGFAELEALGGFGMPGDIEESFDYAVTGFVQSLLN